MDQNYNATIARDHSLHSTKGTYRLLNTKNVFLDFFAMGFEKHNFKKIAQFGKKSII